MKGKNALLLAAGLALASVASAAPVIVNGNFETDPVPAGVGYGAITGWTTTPTCGLNTVAGPFMDTGTIPLGSNCAFIQMGPASMSQDVAGFEAGKTYTLRYRQNARNWKDANFPTNHPNLEVLVNGVAVVASADVISAPQFQLVEVNFTSPGTGTFPLVFQGPAEDGAPAVCIDTISIVEQGQPEPYVFPLLGWPMQAIKTTTAPTLDGVINVATEYDPTGLGAVPVVLNLSTLTAADPYQPNYTHQGTMLNGGTVVSNDADASCLAYFLWDANALYVAVEAKDDVLNPIAHETQDLSVNRGDTLQLCLDIDNLNASGVGEGTKAFIPSWALETNNNDPQWFNQFWPVGANRATFSGTTWSLVTNATGYVLEARIPWTDMQRTAPAVGYVGGALLMMEDNDNPGTAFLYTAGNGVNIIGAPSAWNDIVFLDEPVLPPPPPASAEGQWMSYE